MGSNTSETEAQRWPASFDAGHDAGSVVRCDSDIERRKCTAKRGSFWASRARMSSSSSVRAFTLGGRSAAGTECGMRCVAGLRAPLRCSDGEGAAIEEMPRVSLRAKPTHRNRARELRRRAVLQDPRQPSQRRLQMGLRFGGFR